MRDDEIPSILAVGAVIGGTLANPAWKKSIQSLAKQVKAARASYCSTFQVNVVYHVPGEVTAPSFTGTRIGRYLKPRRLLIVDAALPREPGDDPDREVRELLGQAIEKAEQFARMQDIQDIGDSLTGIRELFEAVCAEYPPLGGPIG